MNINHFLILNGILGFFSDIALNILSNYNFINLNTLRPYFEDRSMLYLAIYASIIIFTLVLISVNIYKIIFNKLPTNEFIYLAIIAFIVGYIADVVADKLNTFPGMRLYYDTVGSGVWGGISILLSVVICYYILYYYNK